MGSGFTLDVKAVDKKLLKALEGFTKSYVKVGFLDDKSMNYPDGTSVVDVAIMNEYGMNDVFWQELNHGLGGYIDIPARPFFHNAWKKNKDKYSRLIEGYLKTLPKKKSSYTEFLNFLGSVVQQDIKTEILETTEPPNSPRTVEIKGFNSPLKRSGTMVNAVQWEIVDDT